MLNLIGVPTHPKKLCKNSKQVKLKQLINGDLTFLQLIERTFPQKSSDSGYVPSLSKFKFLAITTMNHHQFPFPATIPNSIPLKFHNISYPRYPRSLNQQSWNQNRLKSFSYDTHSLHPSSYSPSSHPPGFPEPIYREFNQKNKRDIGGNFEDGEIREDIRTIYLSNVSSRCSKMDLIKTLGVFGRVEKVFTHENRQRSGSQFVFARYSSKAEAEVALKRVKGTRRFGLFWNTAWANRNLEGGSDSIGRKDTCLGVEDEDVIEMLDNSWLIVNAIPIEIREVKKMLAEEGLEVKRFIQWGKFGLIAICDETMMDEWHRKLTELNSWFTKVMKIGSEVSTLRRFCWVEVQGIPLKAWSMTTMKNIAGKVGEFLGLDKETDDLERIDIARFFLETKRQKRIEEEVEIQYKRKYFKVSIKELDIPSSIHDSRMEGDKDELSMDNKKKHVRRSLSKSEQWELIPGKQFIEVGVSVSKRSVKAAKLGDLGLPGEEGRTESKDKEDCSDKGQQPREELKTFELGETSCVRNDKTETDDIINGAFDSPEKITSVFRVTSEEDYKIDDESKVVETPTEEMRTPIFVSRSGNQGRKVNMHDGEYEQRKDGKKIENAVNEQCICCKTFNECRKNLDHVAEGGDLVNHSITGEKGNKKDNKGGLGGKPILQSQKEGSNPAVVFKSPKVRRGRPKGSKGKSKFKKKKKKGCGRKAKVFGGKSYELEDSTSDNIEESDSEDDLEAGIRVCERVGVRIRDQDNRRVRFQEFIGDIDSEIKKRKEEEQKKGALVN